MGFGGSMKPLHSSVKLGMCLFLRTVASVKGAWSLALQMEPWVQALPRDVFHPPFNFSLLKDNLFML